MSALKASVAPSSRYVLRRTLLVDSADVLTLPPDGGTGITVHLTPPRYGSNFDHSTTPEPERVSPTRNDRPTFYQSSWWGVRPMTRMPPKVEFSRLPWPSRAGLSRLLE